MKFEELLSINAADLPDELLASMYRAIHAEVSRRRLVTKTASKRKIAISNRGNSINSRRRLSEFGELINQDWTDLYPKGDGCQEKKHYVYAHVTKMQRTLNVGEFNFPGVPFYIGKGVGDRAFDLKRNEGHGVELRNLLSSGRLPKDIVFMVKDGMTENEALCLEAKLIYFFGTRFDEVHNGVLVNLVKPKVKVE